MGHYLPPAIMAYFMPRNPPPFAPPVEKKVEVRPIIGLAGFVDRFDDPMPDQIINKTNQEIKKEKKDKRDAEQKDALEKRIEEWKPKERTGDSITGDAMRTLFVARLSYDLTDVDIKNEFSFYGAVKKVTLVKDDKTGKSRGYAFVEFERTEDFIEVRPTHNKYVCRPFSMDVRVYMFAV